MQPTFHKKGIVAVKYVSAARGCLGIGKTCFSAGDRPARSNSQAYFPVAAADYAHRLGSKPLKRDWVNPLDLPKSTVKSVPTRDGLESLLPLSLACLCESSHQHPETNDLTFGLCNSSIECLPCPAFSWKIAVRRSL